MPTVIFLPDGVRVEVGLGSSILEASRLAAISLPAICGGRGICGRCKVRVLQGAVSPPTKAETRLLKQDLLSAGIRLACQTRVLGNVKVEVPEAHLLSRQKLAIIGFEPKTELKPSVVQVDIQLEQPSLFKVKPYDVALCEALEAVGFKVVRLSIEALRKLPEAVKEGNFQIVATLSEGEVLDVSPRDSRRDLYGFAVDLGSTKIAGFLVDLKTGETVYADGIVNPQVNYGEDVVSRISYVLKSKENLKQLRKLVVEALNRLISAICSKVGVPRSSIYEVILVGNTAMHHIFYGIDPSSLVFNPYPAVAVKPLRFKASQLGIDVNPSAYLYSPPNIAGFVGADAVADILASRIFESDKLTLLVDIGTNTEIVLGCSRRLLCCSAASGPAFEGMQISYGMKAVEGAIERVSVKPDLEVEYSTIGGAKPRGICGSGIIDAVAELFKAGVVSSSGVMKKDTSLSRLKLRSGQPEFVLAWAEESAINRDITISQKDVREVQKAKAAIAAGWRILLKHYGSRVEDVEEILVAGAFGTYVNPESAKIIGLLPDVSSSKIRFLGNTAGSGARLLLKNIEERRKVEEIVGKVEYIEIAADPDFHRMYLNSLGFPYLELKGFKGFNR